jgi:hypothetical protein
MATLVNVMAYFCARYPHKDELSKARLSKMVYLGDWRMALDHGRQMTDLEWTFNHYGPYLDDIKNAALHHPERFAIKSDLNMYGSPKEVIRLLGDYDGEGVTDSERTSLDHVIEATKTLNWNQFIKFVYSTYPIVTQPRYVALDLVGLASEYRKVRQNL